MALTRLVAALAVAFVAVGAGSPAGAAGPDGRPVAVHLATVDPAVVQQFDPDQVWSALRDRLARRNALALTVDPETALVVLRVRECLPWVESHGETKVTGRPIKEPTGGHGIGTGTEETYGVTTTSTRRVILTVRATWGDRFFDLRADERDRSLRAAADTVARSLEVLVKRERGRVGSRSHSDQPRPAAVVGSERPHERPPRRTTWPAASNLRLPD